MRKSSLLYLIGYHVLPWKYIIGSYSMHIKIQTTVLLSRISIEQVRYFDNH